MSRIIPAALSQVGAEQKFDSVISLQAQARILEQQERWAEAAAKYTEVLQVDSNLQEAKQALARSQQRAKLSDDLDYGINNADRLNEDNIWQGASAVLARAQAVQNPGPVLTGQIQELGRLLEIARTPVTVRFESDNLTDVIVYKVGKLGKFSNTSLQLRPGVYVAVGSRDGFRDVRRQFRVAPDGNVAPVVLRCEDPI